MRFLNLREVKGLVDDLLTCGTAEYMSSDNRPMLFSQFYVTVYDDMFLISMPIRVLALIKLRFFCGREDTSFVFPISLVGKFSISRLVWLNASSQMS